MMEMQTNKTTARSRNVTFPDDVESSDTNAKPLNQVAGLETSFTQEEPCTVDNETISKPYPTTSTAIGQPQLTVGVQHQVIIPVQLHDGQSGYTCKTNGNVTCPSTATVDGRNVLGKSTQCLIGTCMGDKCNISGGDSLNLGSNEPDKSLPSSTFTADPIRSRSESSLFEGFSTEYKAACQVLGEVIDEAISRIEGKEQEQQTREFDPAYCEEIASLSQVRASHRTLQPDEVGIHNQPKVQLKERFNVKFATPIEKCRLYTPSPDISQASTMEISENEGGDAEQSQHYHDEAVDKNTALNSSYQHCGPNVNEPKMLIVDVQDDRITVNNNQNDKVDTTVPKTNQSSAQCSEANSKKTIKDGTVELGNNSKKIPGYNETVQITPGDCQIHYPKKQMFLKIESDIISSSCDLFDSTDNQTSMNPTAAVEIATSTDLLSNTPKGCSKLSCHGNEMENQKQSYNSDPSTADTSTRVLTVVDPGRKDPIMASITGGMIARSPNEQSNKFTSSAELFSQTPECNRLHVIGSHLKEEVKLNVAENKSHPHEDSTVYLLGPEPNMEIVKLIYDHPDATLCPQQANKMPQHDGLDIILKINPVAVPNQPDAISVDHKHAKEGPTNRSDQEKDQNGEGWFPNLVHDPSSSSKLSKSCNVPSNRQNSMSDVVVEKNDSLTDQVESLCGKMGISNVYVEVDGSCTKNQETKLQESSLTNEWEPLVVTTRHWEEQRRIDGDYTPDNNLIANAFESSGKGSTELTSMKCPTTNCSLDVSHLDQARHPDSYLPTYRENEMINEGCVSSMQGKANESPVIPVGLSVVQENFIEEINLDSFPKTSMPPSIKDLLPQIAESGETQKHRPVEEAIPLKVDQSSAFDPRWPGTSGSEPEREGLDAETTTCNLPEIHRLLSNESPQKVPNNTTLTPDLPAQLHSNRKESNFPGFGISDSIEIAESKETQPDLLEISPPAVGVSIECRKEQECAVSTSQTQINQLVDALVDAISEHERVSVRDVPSQTGCEEEVCRNNVSSVLCLILPHNATKVSEFGSQANIKSEHDEDETSLCAEGTEGDIQQPTNIDHEKMSVQDQDQEIHSKDILQENENDTEKLSRAEILQAKESTVLEYTNKELVNAGETIHQGNRSQECSDMYATTVDEHTNEVQATLVQGLRSQEFVEGKKIIDQEQRSQEFVQTEKTMSKEIRTKAQIMEEGRRGEEFKNEKLLKSEENEDQEQPNEEFDTARESTDQGQRSEVLDVRAKDNAVQQHTNEEINQKTGANVCVHQGYKSKEFLEVTDKKDDTSNVTPDVEEQEEKNSPTDSTYETPSVKRPRMDYAVKTSNGERCTGEMNHNVDFLAPSQPQYRLYDTYYDELEDKTDDVPDWFDPVVTSQPQYNLFDRENRQKNPHISNTIEVQRRLPLLRLPTVDPSTGRNEAPKGHSGDDQKVPAMSFPGEDVTNAMCNTFAGNFKWKRVSLDDDNSGSATTDARLIDEACVPEVPFVVPNIQHCNKPVRIGLSRKERVTRLHPYLKLNLGVYQQHP